MKKINLIEIISICFVAVSIALMWLPSGVAMGFVSDPGPPMEYVLHSYPYISGMPIGYGNWFPIITALLTFAILLMLIFITARKATSGSNTKTAVLICLSVCIIASPLSWLIFGGAYAITVVGITVFALHLATLVLLLIERKKLVTAQAQ